MPSELCRRRRLWVASIQRTMCATARDGPGAIGITSAEEHMRATWSDHITPRL